MIRFYIEGKSNDWLDTVTSKVQYFKGTIRSHRFTMMRADENLISRVIGLEAEKIQKDVKYQFDPNDVMESGEMFDMQK